MVFLHPAVQQVPVEYRIEKVRFSAAAYAGDDFDQTVMLPFNQLVKIKIPCFPGLLIAVK